MADVAATLAGWSSTTASNAPSGATTVGTGLDDNLREIQGVVVRGLSHKGADIASATTTDIGAVEGLAHDITGTTTITGLGTVRAGIVKYLKFEGALTLTHNATSLILPGAANITTADGDIGIFISEGSGNWRCVSYVKASGYSVIARSTITLGTEQATTSGTAIDFTGIPAGVRRITVTFVGVSTNGTSALILRLGDAGGIEATGYTSAAGQFTSAANSVGAATTQFALTGTLAATDTINGSVILSLEDSSDNTWSSIGLLYLNNTATMAYSAGTKATSAVLTQLRVTTNSGDTFDAGAINISYET